MDVGSRDVGPSIQAGDRPPNPPGVPGAPGPRVTQVLPDPSRPV